MLTNSRFNSFTVSRLVALLAAATVSISANGVGFKFGEISGSWDTTMTYGQTYRMQSAAPELIGIANGGTAFSVNGDDGNLNYHKGLVNQTAKFTTEIEVNYLNFGAFFRGTGFKNFEADHISNDTERTPLSGSTIRLNGENFSLLDAYIWAEFDLGTMPFSIRAGEQVLSWGESTFIQNSINVINPVDVSKLRVPGAELKEALTPVGILSASLGLTENISVEAYWQYDYEQVRIDPTGTYFSTSDFAGANGSFVTLGFGRCPDYITFPGPAGLTATPNFPGGVCNPLLSGAAFSAKRVGDVRPDEGEEYGVALRIFAPALNDTEFGLYHIKYHSRLPVINAISGAPGIGSPPLNATLTGSPASYFISYPEDIRLYGLSFNTQLGSTGWALQGEYSFRNDAPLQIDDVELLGAALHFEGLNPLCVGLLGGSCTSQLGAVGNGVVIPGFIERDISQVQMTGTKIFANYLKADQIVVLGEFAVTHVHGMPDESELRLDAAGTNLPGNAITAQALTLAGGGALVPTETNDFADETSWGYRLVARMTYNNVIGAINLTPRVAWRHDVSGNTPGPGGNFIEGFKQVTVGLGAEYQNSWRADLSYTPIFGAGSQNLLQDRDFLAFSVSYSF